MNRRTVLLTGAAGLLLGPRPAPAAETQETRLILQVVRLRPGETRKVELALPAGVPFRTSGQSGRDSLEIGVLPDGKGGQAPTPVQRESKDNRFTGHYPVSADLTVVWSDDSPGIDFQAGKEARPGTTDLAVRYESFGPGGFVGGYRVVVEAPDPVGDRHIVPVVALAPGETKDVLFSTGCSLATRGRGLVLTGMRDGRPVVSETYRPDAPPREQDKVFKHGGVTVAFSEDPNEVPPPSPGVNYFWVRVTAANGAKAGRIDLHVRDETCNGACATDLRVLVTAR